MTGRNLLADFSALPTYLLIMHQETEKHRASPALAEKLTQPLAHLSFGIQGLGAWLLVPPIAPPCATPDHPSSGGAHSSQLLSSFRGRDAGKPRTQPRPACTFDAGFNRQGPILEKPLFHTDYEPFILRLACFPELPPQTQKGISP